MNLLSPKMDAIMDNKNLLDEIDRASKRDSSKTSGKSNYDKFNVEGEITKNFEFTLGMEFTSLQQFKDAVLEHNALNGRKIKFAKNDRLRVRAVCKFNKKCGYVILVSRVAKTIVFRVKTLCPEHTCGRVFANKSVRSKLFAKVLAKHNNNEEQPARQELPKLRSLTTATKKRERSNRKNPSDVKPKNKKTKKGLNACSTLTNNGGLEQQQPKVFVDEERLNQGQEDMLARNTFAKPDFAMNLVATAAADGKKRKKNVTRKLNLKKMRTSDRIRALTVRRRVYDGPGNDARSPIVIDDNDDDDDAASPIMIDDDDDGDSYDPKVGSCMHALRNWNEMFRSIPHCFL